MPKPRPHSRLRRIGAPLFVASLLVWTGCSDLTDQAPTAPPVQEQPVERPSTAELAATQDFGPAQEVARARTPALMSIPGVVGTGVGLNAAGRPALKVFLAHDGVAGIPDQLDGVPVSRVVTGLFVARTDRTARTRPAPIGISIGHPEITAGTLGARVTDGTNVYILSNNHVIANSNVATVGDATLQPGPFDGGIEPGDLIGTLHDFQQILFNGPNNTMDAAIALVDPEDVSGATPTDEGYGAPGTTVTPATIGMDVQKYGRTTGHTFGQVAETNVTVNVCYGGSIFCTQVGVFVGQISISPGSFSDGGDSGSLVVTDGNGNNPVGLLFAGSDTRTLANPIGPVLARFGVSIDPTVPDGGGDPGGDPNVPPTASFTHDCTDLTCTFDASGSSDPDGSITSWQWTFGDGGSASGETLSYTYADASGSPYTVTLTVRDNDTATDATSQQVAVSDPGGDPNAPPTASFTHNCTDLTCTFDASGSSDSDGVVTAWLWTLGDGASASGETLNYTYADASGSPYTVTLTVRDDENATGVTSQQVTVSEPTGDPNAPPIASFTHACTDLTCTFNASGSSDSDGSITAWLWTLGDGASASGETLNYTYADASGSPYTVTLTVRDNENATGVTSQQVTVSEPTGDPNVPPTPSFTHDCTDLTCSFDASGSFDDDGTVTAWLWTLGDGASASGETLNYTYADATGSPYTVTLTVRDDENATGVTSQQVTVSEPEGGSPNVPPTASFTFACTDLACSFDASGSSDGDGSITSWLWNLGDGAVASGETVNYTYADASGSPYTVFLTVTDDDDATDVTSQSVTVSEPGGGDPNAPPTASFTHDCTDLACSFDATGSADGDGSITSWQWTFGDGASASGETVNHTYADASGSPYTVTLTVTDDDDATDVTSQQVAVSEPVGDAIPSIDQFNASARTTGPWARADVTWSVSDADGDLAQVTSSLVDASGNVLDSITTLVSGVGASGEHNLRARDATPVKVVLIVSDANGNGTTQEIAF